MIPQSLGPGDETQRHEDLGLHLNRDVEVLGNRIHAERDAAWAIVRLATRHMTMTPRHWGLLT